MRAPFVSRLIHQSFRTRLVVTLGSVGAYSVAFVAFYSHVGPVMASFSAFPGMLAGWFFGVRAGLICSLLTFPLDLILYNRVSSDGWSIMVRSGPAGLAVVVILSMAAGAFHNLQEQLRVELAERRRTEEIAARERSQLEDTVRKRTGELQQIVAQLQREISERKRAEEKLAAERNLLRTLIDHSPDYIFIKDSQGRFIISNLAHARASQADTEDQMVGKTAFEFFPVDLAAQFHADDLNVMRSGKSLVNVERVTIDTEGSKKWVLTTKVPLRDDAGGVIGLMGMSRDITQRKQDEQALRQARDELEQRVAERTGELAEANTSLRAEIAQRLQAEENLAAERNLLRTLIDNLPHNIYAKDSQSRFTIVNRPQSRMLGVASQAEAIGKRDADFYPTDLAAAYYADDMLVIGAGEPLLDYEEMSTDESGSRIWILTSKLPLRDMHGQVIGLVGIGINITDRKRAEEQRVELAIAEEKADLLKEFISNISHDIKTPLSIINTNIYVLEKSRSEDILPRLQIIKAQTWRLNKLIQDIITISRLDRLPELSLQRVDVNQMISDIEGGFRSVAEKKKLTYSRHSGADLPPILADENEMCRVMTNLIENAVNYTPDGGSVSVHTWSQGDKVVVEIRDTGIGIGDADLPHIFEHFYRSDKARSTNTGGTGLGLAMVKRIVEIHHGSIEVESVPGQGSTFRVSLPAAAAAKSGT